MIEIDVVCFEEVKIICLIAGYLDYDVISKAQQLYAQMLGWA